MAALLAAATEVKAVSFAGEIRPLLRQYCFDCHNNQKRKADLSLESFTDESQLHEDKVVWERVQHQLARREMPPASRPQPSEAERGRVLAWIEGHVLAADCRNPDPGRVTIRRLNRVEYRNSVRDLLGVDFQPAAYFPADDAGYGFDHIGDVLSLSPLLLEKYLRASQEVLDLAISETSLSSDSKQAEAPPAGSLPAQRFGPGEAGRSQSGRPWRTPQWSELQRQLGAVTPGDRGKDTDNATVVLRTFARRAFRRPVTELEVQRLRDLFNRSRVEYGQSFLASLKFAMQAVLVSPHFLFRSELQVDPIDARAVHSISDHALASRLSYFLWSSVPDDELLAEADRGALRANLESQVRRMLRSWKAQALVDNFAGQWLQIRNLELVTPDPKLFPGFDAALRRSMQRETELFVASVIREDRNVLEFLDADYTFVDGRLAHHYGITNITGTNFQRVSLAGLPRRGVLGHASVLTITSNPTRTSPVKRGKWVLETLLGSPPPPPPPDVPELNEAPEAELTGSLRQRMEQHRQNPNCISCHERMDPIGFGLENFDAIGGWRERDGNFPLETAGRLVSGETFATPQELYLILRKTKHQGFVRCLAERMLTYALGRGTGYADRCALDEITRRVEQNQYRVSALVLAIVQSVPFQMSRGEGTGTP